jgi:hypothetical protein
MRNWAKDLNVHIFIKYWKLKLAKINKVNEHNSGSHVLVAKKTEIKHQTERQNIIKGVTNSGW